MPQLLFTSLGEARKEGAGFSLTASLGRTLILIQSRSVDAQIMTLGSFFNCSKLSPRRRSF